MCNLYCVTVGICKRKITFSFPHFSSKFSLTTNELLFLLGILLSSLSFHGHDRHGYETSKALLCIIRVNSSYLLPLCSSRIARRVHLERKYWSTNKGPRKSTTNQSDILFYTQSIFSNCVAGAWSNTNFMPINCLSI